MKDHVIDLPGLEGQNPLGFFAALGLLRIVDEHARAASMMRPLLAFSADPPFAARFAFDATREQLNAIVRSDAVSQETSVALRLAYDQDGALCSTGEPDATRDLKPAPAVARQYLRLAANASRREADLAAALLSDVVQDNNGASKPTAFHFIAGRQRFLKMVEDLRTGTDEAASTRH